MRAYAQAIMEPKAPTQNPVPMIPLAEFKHLLGPGGEHLSDAQLTAIRDTEDRLAGILFDLWLRERGRSPGSPAERPATHFPASMV